VPFGVIGGLAIATLPTPRVFDADGSYVSESQHPSTPCGLFMSADQHIWPAHGHTGQIMKLNPNDKVVGTMAGAG
jgi:hypothetical protein